jgi:hypothetical protein
LKIKSIFSVIERSRNIITSSNSNLLSLISLSLGHHHTFHKPFDLHPILSTEEQAMSDNELSEITRSVNRNGIEKKHSSPMAKLRKIEKASEGRRNHFLGLSPHAKGIARDVTVDQEVGQFRERPSTYAKDMETQIPHRCSISHVWLSRYQPR